MSYEVRVFYKTGDLPESFTVGGSECMQYDSGMLMLIDRKDLQTHIPLSVIERVEIEEINEEEESE